MRLLIVHPESVFAACVVSEIEKGMGGWLWVPTVSDGLAAAESRRPRVTLLHGRSFRDGDEGLLRTAQFVQAAPAGRVIVVAEDLGAEDVELALALGAHAVVDLMDGRALTMLLRGLLGGTRRQV